MASEPDTYEWTLREAAADINQAGRMLRTAGTSADPAMLSIAHSLHALATMLHYVFADDYDDSAAEGVSDG